MSKAANTYTEMLETLYNKLFELESDIQHKYWNLHPNIDERHDIALSWRGKIDLVEGEVKHEMYYGGKPRVEGSISTLEEIRDSFEKNKELMRVPNVYFDRIADIIDYAKKVVDFNNKRDLDAETFEDNVEKVKKSILQFKEYYGIELKVVDGKIVLTDKNRTVEL